MAFKGPYPTIFSGHATAMVISHTTFSGGVTNTGTIGSGGISVVSGAFLSGGGILDTGTVVGGIKVDSSSKIVASGGVTQTAIAVKNTSTFGGGISNAGLISAAQDGTLAGSVSTFSGGVRNSGTIVAGRSAVTVSNATIFTGGITNSGQIFGGGTSGVGVGVNNVVSFSGGILNASGGTISGALLAVDVEVDSFVSGGIVNSGTLLAQHDSGIRLRFISTFVGAIANNGTISANLAGIGLLSDTAYSASKAGGGIVNTGDITARIGIDIGLISIFSGTISNNGMISATGTGILIGAATFGSTPVSSFVGSVVNSGTIAATTGIGVATATINGAIVDGGTILATSRGIQVGGGGVVSGGIAVASHGTISARTDIALLGVTIFAGGIANRGTLSGSVSGIYLSGVSTFAGGLTNSGEISAQALGIDISQSDLKFTGGITNSGAITAGTTGILLSVSTFTGNIINGGLISAGSAGSGIDLIDISTFAGGISNTGAISAGLVGVGVGFNNVTVSSFTGNVFNNGTISAKTGIAVVAQTTLAYAENGARTGGTLTVTDGRHAAAIALLGNYMAGSFFTTADGHGGTLVTETQPQQHTLLTHPQA